MNISAIFAEVMRYVGPGVVWCIVYMWTIFSWTIGLYGIVSMVRLAVMFFRGRIVGDREGEVRVEYGNVLKKEITNALTHVGIFAAWWYMVI